MMVWWHDDRYAIVQLLYYNTCTVIVIHTLTLLYSCDIFVHKLILVSVLFRSDSIILVQVLSLFLK